MIVPILICKIYVTTKITKGIVFIFFNLLPRSKIWQLLITFYYRVYKIVYSLTIGL